MSGYVTREFKNLISIKSIITLHNLELAKDYIFEGEKHDFWEILYVKSGEFLVTCDGTEHILKQGQAIFHKPNQFHENRAVNGKPSNVFVISFICDSPAMSYFNDKIIWLDPELKYILDKVFKVGNLTYSLPENQPNMKELLLKKQSLLGGTQLVKNYLEEFLILLLQSNIKNHAYYDAYVQNIDDYDDIVDEIIFFLHSNIYNNIAIPDICNHVNYGKTYISTKFKKCTGISIMDFYTNLKIEEAKVKFENHQYNITQISEVLCFSSPYHFSKAFKQNVGIPPKEYINLYVKNKTNAS